MEYPQIITLNAFVLKIHHINRRQKHVYAKKDWKLIMENVLIFVVPEVLEIYKETVNNVQLINRFIEESVLIFVALEILGRFKGIVNNV